MSSTIPLYTLLIIYLLFVIVLVGFYFISFYHLWVTASLDNKSFLISMIVAGLMFSIIGITFVKSTSIHWTDTLFSFQSGPTNNSF